MKASIRIGVMALMVLSIFGGVALADPIVGGGDAGNTASQASTLESAIPLNSWSVYLHGHLWPGTDPDDWYRLNTQNGEYLKYQLDLGDYDIAAQRITDTSGNVLNASQVNYGTTKKLSGPTLSWDTVKGTDSSDPEYEFAMERTLSP